MIKTGFRQEHFVALESALKNVPAALSSTLCWRFFSGWISLLLILILAGCSSPQVTLENLRITVEVDGKLLPLQVPAGTTSQGALQQAGVALSNLDRVVPPSYTILASNDVVRVTRVREVFTVEEKIIPFEHQTVHNESLPEGKTLLVQRGVNGVEQVTYRQVFEDEVEVLNTTFKSDILAEPMPEIVMIGVQKPFAPVTIPGKLVYLSGGNAWLMEISTRERRPVVTSGDLDGRIFLLSPKGDWLLFTRAEKPTAGQSTAPSEGDDAGLPPINSLWAIDLTEENTKPVNLKVQNVIHFAAWVPAKGLTIAFSTVEPRQTAPGWQANNDLRIMTFSATGATGKQETILETNAGGVYGWWGSNFAWSPDGELLAYARPDSVGLVDLKSKTLAPLVNILPFQTGSDWAWVPGLGWSYDRQVLYLVSHAAKAGMEGNESSPLFDLSALPLGKQASDGGPLIQLSPQAGMFAYPVPSPKNGSQGYQVAYLNAIFPEQSASKRYRLALMDRDGSNRKVVFPAEDRQGLDPQRVAWSPEPFANGHYWIAVNYQGDLWLVDSETAEAQPVTGDGLISRFDWK